MGTHTSPLAGPTWQLPRRWGRWWVVVVIAVVMAVVLLLVAALPAAAQNAPAAPACPPAPASPTAAQWAQARASDRGFLWKLRRDGRTSWLYGSLHVGRPAWVAPGPQVAAALAASQVLALEIDPADPATAGALVAEPAASSADGAAPADEALPPALQQRLDRAVAAACLPEGALSAMAPALQAVVLSVLEARWLGLDPAFSQELALSHQARSQGLPVVALETVALQKQVLVPARADDAHSLVAAALTQLEQGRGRRSIATLAQAWAQGDLATLADHARWCGCADTPAERAALQRLNDARNPALAQGIVRLHAEGRSVFAAVGALHMTGPAALPRLLADQGFQVQRVPLKHPAR
jgi:uncharacterized protein YbaP (TraB family)